MSKEVRDLSNLLEDRSNVLDPLMPNAGSARPRSLLLSVLLGVAQGACSIYADLPAHRGDAMETGGAAGDIGAGGVGGTTTGAGQGGNSIGGAGGATMDASAEGGPGATGGAGGNAGTGGAVGSGGVGTGGNAGRAGAGGTNAGGTAGTAITDSGPTVDGGGAGGANGDGSSTGGSAGRAGSSGTAGATGQGGSGGGGGSAGSAGASGGASGSGGTSGAAGSSGSGGSSGADAGSKDAPSEAGGLCSTGACKRVFVTSSSPGTTGAFGLANADSFCQSAATSTQLGGTWKAWLSNSSNAAASRLVHATVPYRLLDGSTIAANWTALVSGSITHAINITEAGVAIPGGTVLEVWTGTTTTGTYSSATCNGWTDGSASGTADVGVTSDTDFGWTDKYLQYCNRTNLRLYCFEQ
jgi:hypothetical protein